MTVDFYINRFMKSFNNYFLGVLCGDGHLNLQGRPELRWVITDLDWFDSVYPYLPEPKSFRDSKVSNRDHKILRLLRIKI